MAKRKLGGLTEREVSLIKGMMLLERFPHDQEILAYFSRPGRTVNNGRLSEIRAAMKGEPMSDAARRFVLQPPASPEEVEAFLASRPPVDPRTGLDLEKDELILKAREAMLLAVQAYNNPTCYFKSELFIVSAIIAWTYLLLAHFIRKKIDVVHRATDGTAIPTPSGQERHLELRKLLGKAECPLDPAMKKNLEYLLGLRDEIEHRGTHRIDHEVSAKLQACALNFDAMLGRLFGPRCRLLHELSMAIQFAHLDAAQRRVLAGARGLPKVIETFNLAFEKDLPEEIRNDPAYAYRIAIVPRAANRPGGADAVYQIVDPASAEGRERALIFKDREKPKFLPGEIVRRMAELGFPGFRMHEHTQLWKTYGAKLPGKGYGVNIGKTWYWYEAWLQFVTTHCQEAGDRYR